VFVTVVMPIRDEADSIRRSLGSVLAQTYPADRYEVIVADGMSGDGTRAIVDATIAHRAQTGRGPRVACVDNPERTVSSALNRAISRASGEFIVRVDGHCELAPEYLATCALVSEETGADVVGGVARAEGKGPQGRAIAAASSSRFGVGTAAWHYADTPRWVDTVPFACYRRSVFARIGGFDEELVRNQDDEFNFRVLQAGGRIRLDPRVRSVYLCRSTLRALARQYFGYGLYKPRVIQKRGRPASVRHLAPGALVALLASSLALTARWRRPAPLVLGAVPYALACVVAGKIAARRTGASAARVGCALATMHLSYGAGFHCGVLRWAARR
jgi:succinoglycan biosynthesis protein ExoA